MNRDHDHDIADLLVRQANTRRDMLAKADATPKPKPPKTCPQCHSNDLEGHDQDFWGDGTASQDLQCGNCFTTWTEQYEFTGIEIT